MEINFNLPDNVITIVTSCFVWGVIAYLAYRIYQKQTDKPKVWKIAVILLIGLISFSIDLHLFDVLVKLAILPLGVWALYIMFKWTNKNWQAYRRFAWLGFLANFIFLASTFLAMPIDDVVYPKEEPATYMARIEDASLVPIHPSAIADGTLNIDRLDKELHTMKSEAVYSDKWYQDTYMNHVDTNERDERFPYQLVGASAAWGSGLHPVIFIENDGRGLLITTAENQLYFRFAESIIEGVE
ncbi:hypothetical protein H8S33_00040 [Ornithinibacillus sp. BX22]|uniref:Uncharacterized protein n=1 Tax=Ornithinibacillus hominis TaxID=2763055 RepID=A0A923L2D3_9BACI|nr:hypothetical protein [Ornithinibacillus hominis]MBC5635202.1 hypothetical protein [Ornithinibacillus hominis]